jgi:hypothetical protein
MMGENSMTSTVTKNDGELLASIGEHKALTVKQLSILSQRSSQVVRRRIRTPTEEELIITKIHGYGRGRGRPEDLNFLTEKGASLLANEGILSGYFTDKEEIPLSIDHLLLVNWFRIHLLQIERSIPQLSVKYLDPNSQSRARDSDDSLSPSTTSNGPEKSIEFIPDGVFSIKIVGKNSRHLGNSHRYIERYAERANLTPWQACLKVISDAEKVLTLILDRKRPTLSRSTTREWSKEPAPGGRTTEPTIQLCN